MLTVIQLPVLTDNYIYVLHDSVANETAVIDPALAPPVLEMLDKMGWQLTTLFNTHHHHDHIGANLILKQTTGCNIVAAEADKHRIPAVDVGVKDNDYVALGAKSTHFARVIATPGHTSGHIAYYFAEQALLFCGDTLFVMGCGHLFEGSAEQMWQSLQMLKALPAATKVYCSHEYSQANGRFALTLEPNNRLLQQRMATINQLRAVNLPTVPSTIALERETNPFFREDSVELQQQLQIKTTDPVAIFAEIRRLKDVF